MSSVVVFFFWPCRMCKRKVLNRCEDLEERSSQNGPNVFNLQAANDLRNLQPHVGELVQPHACHGNKNQRPATEAQKLGKVESRSAGRRCIQPKTTKGRGGAGVGMWRLAAFSQELVCFPAWFWSRTGSRSLLSPDFTLKPCLEKMDLGLVQYDDVVPSRCTTRGFLSPF